MALTQREWSAILVAGWHKDASIAWALHRVIGLFPGDRISDEEMISGQRETHGLWPRVRHNSWARPLRDFLAANCRFASEALWDGDEKKALTLIDKPGFRARRSFAPTEQEKRKDRRDARCTKFVKAREIDKRRDWHTVK